MSSRRPAKAAVGPLGGRWAPPDLNGQVAVVTGATRGVGRGIAEVLGQCGATVYVTGRSTRQHPTVGESEWSIEAAAEAVTAGGGRGVPVRCDHSVDAEVERLFAQVEAEHGRLDLLVNNATGNDYHGDPTQTGGIDFDKTWGAMFAPVWAKPVDWWDANMGVGVRSSFVACRYGLPLMLGHRSLVVFTTEPLAEEAFHPDPIYDLRAHSTRRMALTFSQQLSPQQVTALCLLPGDVQTHTRRKGTEDEPLTDDVESVYFAGRAVAALAVAEDLSSHAGKALHAWECALAYGFTDVHDAVPGAPPSS